MTEEGRTTNPGTGVAGTRALDASAGGLMSLLGRSYLSKAPNRLAAYNRLQAALMRRFLKRGGTMERWLKRIAPAFRTRYGWLCEQPVSVSTGEHRLPPTPTTRNRARASRKSSFTPDRSSHVPASGHGSSRECRDPRGSTQEFFIPNSFFFHR